MTELDGLDHSQRVETVLSTLRDILAGMGIVDVTPESVVAAPRFYDGRVLIEDTDSLNRFLGQPRTDHPVLVDCVSGISTADVAEASLFGKQLCLRHLSVHERIVGDEADDAVILDIDEWRVTVHDRHAEVVVEAEFQRPRLQVAIPIGRLFSEPKVPFADAGGVVAAFFQ